MAGVQWSDGKMHGATEAKNSMMHDTKDTRLIHGHSNPDIDLTKTPNNMSYRGLIYKEKCARYDELMDKVRIKRKSSGKNTNVTLQKMVELSPIHSKSEDADADSLEYAKKERRQAEEEAKRIIDQAKSEAEAMAATARTQADELSRITLQQVMARMTKMRAKLELEAKEKEESNRNQERALQEARAALEQDRMAVDRMKADMDASREQVERERRETAKWLAISRTDHLQQRRLNQKALSTEIAATDRLIALNSREESLARQERELRPVAVTYNVLKAIHEHERKSENRESANAIREALRVIYNANSIPDSWLHGIENEYMRNRHRGDRSGSEIAASTARPLPTVANNMPDY